MAFSVKHTKHSTKDDGTDSSRVRPTDWNADHTVLASSGTVLGRPAGATPDPGPIVELPLSAILPAGIVLPFAGLVGVIPAGFLLCNGATYTRAAPYDKLFAVCQTAFGNGDGSGTTFSVPYLYGRTIAGMDPAGSLLTAPWLAPNGNTLGGYGGIQAFSLSYGHMPAHTHGASVNEGGGHAHGLSGGRQIDGGSGDNTFAAYENGTYIGAGGRALMNNATTGLSVTIGYAGTDSPGGTGPAAAHNNLQPTLLMNWIIKY